MEGGAEGNLLEMSKQPIACTFTCMYMVGGYSKGGEANPPTSLNESLIFSVNGDYYDLTTELFHHTPL